MKTFEPNLNYDPFTETMATYPIWAILHQPYGGSDKSWRVIEYAEMSPVAAVKGADPEDDCGHGCVVYPTGKFANQPGYVTSFGDQPGRTSGVLVKKHWATEETP